MSTGTCYQYSDRVPNSGTFAPDIQSAQLSTRVQVVGGSTLLYTSGGQTMTSVFGGSTIVSSITASYVNSGVYGEGGTTFTYAPQTMSSATSARNTIAPAPSGTTSKSAYHFSRPIFGPGSPATTIPYSYMAYPSVSTVQTLSSATVPTSLGPTETAYAELSCPSSDGQVITENGVSYVIGCDEGVTGISYLTEPAANTFNDCFSQCDQMSTGEGALYCTGFLYLGVTSGAGPGTCYLYNDVGKAFVTGNSSAVSAIRLDNYVAGPLVAVSASLSIGVGAEASLSASLPGASLPINTDAPGSLTSALVGLTSGTDGINEPSSSTILDFQASVTVAGSPSIGASVGAGVGIDSSGLSASLGVSAGVGLSATLGAGASITGILPGNGAATSGSVSKITTVIPVVTVQSTTTITSCSTAVGGALTCSNIPLLATLSTTSNTGSATVYIAYTTTVTTTSMTLGPSALTSCLTLINGAITCLPLDALNAGSSTVTSTTKSSSFSTMATP
ncbi:hypothetical protein B0A50_06390 [Salinomyces thailandicus]|uniref:Apple domain-containing protein n=1 Tax=Salinomyces thailandicus TaxID=706561 RepID=A0A4U0TRA1_9PEZI|nr:hypothetical protein B0A50_06390 [Salinomyces thailandica]